MAQYKIRNEQGDLITTTDLAKVMEAKGIKRLGQTAAAARAARARLVPVRAFKGTPVRRWAGVAQETPAVPLEQLAAANDIEGYVKTWRALNFLTQ